MRDAFGGRVAPTARARSCAIASRRLPSAARMRSADHAIAIGIQRAEAQVLQFRLEPCSCPGAARSARRSRAFRARCGGAIGASIAPSVRMLCRRSESLIRITRRSRAIASSILRKLSAAASCRLLKLTLSSLVTPSTSSATVAPNSPASSLRRERRVFERVVQDRRDDRLGVHAELGQDAGHGDRMRDVRLTALAGLTLMRPGTDFVGADHARHLRLGQVGHTLLQGQDVRRQRRRILKRTDP